MGDEQKPKYLEDIARYQYADVANRLGSNEADAPFARGALEKLVDSFGVDKDILEGLKAGTFASEEGVAKAIQIYHGKYQKALGSCDVTEFYNLRYNTLKSLLGDEKANEAKSVFEKYKGQTVGSITKKYTQAQAIVNDKTGLFDDKKKEEAQKTIKKMEAIFHLIQTIEKRNYDELKNSATKSAYKESINELLKVA
ncbi:MAG: hypothetical protein M1416_01305 [Candidatus Pacearchaeota archaeon]|nr:hypothetical protein [Candidatus Pacearchaeota archaeon]